MNYKKLADMASYFKESKEGRNEMCEAMEKLIKKERSEERAKTCLEMDIHSDQDDQEWKVQRRGNCQSQRDFPRKSQADTEDADRKLVKYPTRID